MPHGDPFTSLCQQAARSRSGHRVDLHLHTTFSDGTYTPAQLVDLARRSGLQALAITDHDTSMAVLPARQAATDRIEIIAGVEITTEYRGQELHLLGYFFDPANVALQKALHWLRRERVARFHAMITRLRELGVSLDVPAGDDQRDGTLGRRHVAELLVHARHADSIRQAFQRYLSDHGRVQVPKPRLPVAEAIALVRGAGGVTSWAHPSAECTRETLVELSEYGLDAVEVDFPSGRPGRKRQLRDLARTLELAVTGGSDCHGPDSPGHTVGSCGINGVELDHLRARCVPTAETVSLP